jgi:hypothetical protein
MSFIEMVQAVEHAAPMPESEAPTYFGNTPIQHSNLEQPNKIKLKKVVRYYVGNMDDPTDREFIADIMTRSYDFSLTGKEEIGTIIVIREDSTWSKDGFYLVAIKYMETIEDLP